MDLSKLNYTQIWNLVQNGTILKGSDLFYIINQKCIPLIKLSISKGYYYEFKHLIYVSYIGNYDLLKYFESIGFKLCRKIFVSALFGFLIFDSYGFEKESYFPYFNIFLYLLSNNVYHDVIKFGIKYNNAMLVHFGFKFKLGDVTDLDYAIQRENVEMVYYIVTLIKPTQKNLILAIQGGNVSIVKILLDSGINF